MRLRARDRLTRDLIRDLRRKGELLRTHESRRAHQIAPSLGALALGAMAIGAVAIGAVAIGALAVGQLAIGRARIKRLEIDELVVRDLDVTGALRVPAKADPEP
jgi:hypothetical protein